MRFSWRKVAAAIASVWLLPVVSEGVAMQYLTPQDLQLSVPVEQVAQAVMVSKAVTPVSLIVCGVSTLKSGGQFDLNPFFDAHHNLWQKSSDKFYPKEEERNAKVTVIHQPRIGVLKDGGTSPVSRFSYIPNRISNPDFEGKDTFTIRVESAGRRTLDIHYKVMIFQSGADFGYEHDCRFASFTDVYGSYQLNKRDADSIVSWLRSTELSTIIANASTALTGFQNLSGTTVGTTVGEGTTTQITLDTDAAGHGWYVDETPLDNTDDDLATSDPNVWKARAGSAADGKMDMLSVLLHEYGHAQGLANSADGNDFMGTSLQSGEHRLPSAAELQLMAQLVAQLKGEANMDIAGGNAPANTPDNGPGLPSLPLDLPLDGLARHLSTLHASINLIANY